MKRSLFATLLASFAVCLAFSQSADAPPRFEAADIRESPKAQNNFPFMRNPPVHAGRWEVKSATMVDLIHLAYNIDADKVLGGPSWLEMNHYDVTAKIPAETTPDAQKLMLQALLAERFKLVVHNDTKPLPTHALVAGKKPQLKEATGSEDPGCKPQTQSTGGPEGGGMKIMMAGSMMGGGDSAPMTLSLGPGGTILYGCRNMSMEAFAANLRGMMGTQIGPNPVIDETGIKGKWNFDVRWSMGIIGPNMNNSDRITLSEALEKQLGLKLEDRQVPMPVVVVDSVNEKPAPNPPGTSDVLPMKPPPTEFEVASVKPATGEARGFRTQMQPGGRVNFSGVPMRLLLMQAFAVNNMDQLAGMPAWVDTERFDVMAKAPSDDATSPALDRDSVAPMLRSLLADRFKMTFHQEDRPMTGYTLMAGKPKLKKADPASRTSCKSLPAPAGAPPGTRVLNCQNVTMAQFAEHLQGMSPELQWPVTNSTGLEGSYDVNLTFTMNFNFAIGPRGGGAAEGSVGAGPAAPSDPSGGISLFSAIEKEFGLKLEKEKRSGPVYVIDHLEQKPTDN